ncbi:MAG: DUF4384 domain-containing protein [Polyangiaceae bacterium]
MRRLGLAALAWSLTGCVFSASATIAPEPAPARRDDGLYLGFVSHSERGPQQNALDAPLHTGDELALVLDLPDARYIYVLNIAPNGTQTLLFPADDPERLEGSVRLPRSGFYQLAGAPGLETLAVVASRQPIALDDAGGAYLFERVAEAEAAELPTIQSAQPPGFADGQATMRIQGPGLTLRGGSLRIASASDVVTMLVTIDHQP